MSLRYRPVDASTWADLRALFEAHGVLDGCWCQWFRLKRADFEAASRPAKRELLHDAVKAGRPVGVLGYDGDRPVAWVAVAPREDHPVLGRSRNLAPLDDRPSWSVTCFYVERPYRGQGVTEALLDEAAKYAAANGATLLEGYPVDAGGKRKDAGGMFHGSATSFARAGYREAARRAPTRPIMRRETG